MLPILELKNIRLSYHSPEGETLAIEDVSIEVEKGEFIAIVGPSGCGKPQATQGIFFCIKKPYKNRVM